MEFKEAENYVGWINLAQNMALFYVFSNKFA